MARARRPINAQKGVSSELKTIGAIAAIVVVGAAYWYSKSGDDKGKDGAKDGAGGAATASVAYAVDQPFKGGTEDQAAAVLVKFTDFQ